jgi:hypothetical protein
MGFFFGFFSGKTTRPAALALIITLMTRQILI